MKSLGSLLDLKFSDNSVIAEKFEKLFLRSEKLREHPEGQTYVGDRLALMFFEPSTRTRMSFESAAHRCGLGPLIFDGGVTTSLEKGETIIDSIMNIAAMEPKAIVIRCGNDVPLGEIAGMVQIPVINAGWGVIGHPTQALLDAVTMRRNLKQLQNKKVLILGDIRHSRVAASHLELLPSLGVEIGQCGPEEFLVSAPGVQTFSRLQDALAWADVAMSLRVQFERHAGPSKLSAENYRKNFGLNAQNLKTLSAQSLIMHPGPINHGIEMESEVLKDSRCKVLEQVTSGVYLREALLRQFFEGDF